MRKFIAMLVVIILVCSLSALAKTSYDFETPDQGGVLVPNPDAGYFTIYERTSDMAYQGSYSMMYVLDDTSAGGTGGEKWEIRTVSQTDPLITDVEFMIDTIFFWMYLPDVGSGVMSWVQPFTQDVAWRWHGNYQSYSSASLDQWDCYPVHIDTLMWDGVTKRELPLKRAGVEFGATDYAPGCTVYIDAVSSESRNAGITIVKDPDKVTIETSINTIKFSLDEPTPVLLSVYNLMGAKVAEIVPGTMSAGSHEMVIDAPAGMYIVKLVAGGVVKKSKLIIL